MESPMNATVMLACLAGTVTVSQPRDVVFQAPKIQVKAQTLGSDGERRPQYTLTYNGINIGTNYLRPANRDDHGNVERDWSRLATTYFHREGPMGVVMEKYNCAPGKSNTYHADARLPLSVIGMAGIDPVAHLGNVV